jgi:hypothetical protein
MRPAGEITDASMLLHYLDFWLTYERRFRAANSQSTALSSRLLAQPGSPQPALFYRGQDGVLRSHYGTLRGGEAHVGQALAILGKLGFASDTPLRTQEGSCTIREAIEGLEATFSLSREPDWSIAALALYLPPATGWRNRWGQRFTFSEAATTLLARPLGQGPCYGTHTLYVLSLLLDCHSRQGVLDATVAAKMRRQLKAASAALEAAQNPDGGWGQSWAEAPGGRRARELSPSSLHVTGHHLEWFAMCEPEDCPSQRCVERALAFCRQKVRTVVNTDVAQAVCDHEHALLALALCEAD